jgi:hypothetical protein
VFNVLPLACPEQVSFFSEITRRFVKFIRSKNVKIVIYLKYRLRGGSSYSAACEVSLFANPIQLN